MIEKPRRDIVIPNDLGRTADPTQQFFHNPTFELDREPSDSLHGKILPPLPREIGSCLLL